MVSLTFVALIAVLGSCATAIPQYAKYTRPPSYPLAVRNPYTNFWLPANNLPGNWPCFWNSRTTGWTGMIRVDGQTYVYLGNPELGANRTLATQDFAAITPTQTIFGLTAGPVSLNVTFFSPVEYSDIQLQSIPVSHVFLNVVSNDGASHSVQVYMDISGEWGAADPNRIITWAITPTPGGLKVWSTESQEKTMYRETNEYPNWGRAVLATDGNASHASGQDSIVRGAFVASGRLGNTNDEEFRCVSCRWPTFAVAHDLGQVGPAGSARIQYVVGTIRESNAIFLNEPQNALWLSYWPTAEEMIDFFYGSLDSALSFADGLDERILNDAFKAGGQYYADILTMSLRQSYAGNEFSGNASNPIYYQKEISSGAFMQTVDVIFPATPMFYYLNITYLKLLLDPLFIQMETGVWTRPFAMHDIGDNYPIADGQGYGGDMPVEESGNMIMMVADIIFHPDANQAESMAYARQHFPVMSTWANYLYENCLYPVDQLSTDDFIGTTELNSGLALKGILAMAAFAKIADFIGEANATQFYNKAVADFVPIWINESMHVDGDHLKMEYNVTNGYQFKYNAFHDKLLNLSVVPQHIYDIEADYYLTKLEPYGIPFVSIRDYTKSDWEIWTAAAFGDENPELRTALIDSIGRMLQVTPQRIPFTDWYVTATSNHVGFIARPVVGGHFALLALDMARGKL